MFSYIFQAQFSLRNHNSQSNNLLFSSELVDDASTKSVSNVLLDKTMSNATYRNDSCKRCELLNLQSQE